MNRGMGCSTCGRRGAVRLMWRRGVTLVELLVSLSLLSMLMLAVIVLLQMAGVTTGRTTEVTSWRIGAESTLRLVRDDLLVGDFLADPDEVPRVETDEGVLEIRTRETGVGPVIVQYRYDTINHRLQRQTEGDRYDAPRVLLDGLGGFRCAIDEETGRLQVSLSSADGVKVAREYVLP